MLGIIEKTPLETPEEDDFEDHHSPVMDWGLDAFTQPS